MPNVGVQVGMGTLAYSAGRFIDTAAEQQVLEAFGLLGEVVRLEERAFDAATALSGSGPAFLALIIEAFEDAGIVSGLSYAEARALILTTVTGTAGRCARRTVCQRTGADGHLARGNRGGRLAEMERQGVRGAIIDGVVAAMRRAGELG